MEDDRCYRFSGGKISFKDDKSTLMVWSSAKFSFHAIDAEDFAEDALVQVLPKEDVNPESKMKCMREVVALDKDHINVSPL